MRTLIGTLFFFATVLTPPLEQLAASMSRELARAEARQPAVPSRGGAARTLLPDGRVLVTGGELDGRPSAAAAIEDLRMGETTTLARGMRRARAWHAASVLPDGRVLVSGGTGVDGKPVQSVERFDPATGSFTLAPVRLVPRTGHTSTLLTDGRLLVVGGMSARGELIPEAELWDAGRSAKPKPTASLQIARSGHTATLLGDGQVLIQGGVDAGGEWVATAEIYDPEEQVFRVADGPLAEPTGSALQGSLPADGATDVAGDRPIALRFALPLALGTVTTDTVILSSSGSVIPVRLVGAEAGSLVFVRPKGSLRPDTSYDVMVDGLTDTSGRPVPPRTVRFRTRRTGAQRPGEGPRPIGTAGGGPGEVSPSPVPLPTNSEAAGGALRPNSAATGSFAQAAASDFDPQWESLPPLRAAPGVTALAGQVLLVDGKPLRDVTLEIDGQATRSDATGRFVIGGLSCSHCVLFIDGRSASVKAHAYGVFEFGYDVATGETTVIMPLWMPELDTANTVTIPSPAPRELIITTTAIPGVELHLPAGAVVRDRDGNVVTQITITPFSTERPIMPPPPGREFPVYFSIQPEAARVESPSGKGAWLVYPNVTKQRPGRRISFLTYDPHGKEWFVYGLGRVSPDGRRIVPDPDTTFDVFRCTPDDPNQDVPPDVAPGEGDCTDNTSPEGGDPCSLSTGLFVHRKTDLVIRDAIPIDVTRTYQTEDPDVGDFGVGTGHQYSIHLFSPHEFSEMNLVLPSGATVHYDRVSTGDGFRDAVFEHHDSPTARFFMSRIRWTGPGWDLSLKDGTTYVFNENYHLISIRDRNGNQVTLTHRIDSKGHPTGRVTRVTSPSGRFIDYSYDSKNRVDQITDNSGRSVGYQYDDDGHLQFVTDVGGGVTRYHYGQSTMSSGLKRMTGITDARDIDYLSNAFDLETGRVVQQTLANGGTYTFGYTTDASGQVTTTIVTDPNGIRRRLTFNSLGHTLSDTRALGLPEQQTTTLIRDPGTDLVSAVIDPLGRRTTYARDVLGNVTAVTRLAGAPDAVRTSFTYEAFNQVHTITDALGHTTTFVHDTHGNLTSVVDPLGDQTTLTYDDRGLPSTVTDPLGQTTRMFYVEADEVAVTDPLGNTTERVLDSVGRTASVTDALGHVTTIQYDPFDDVITRTGPSGGATLYQYDASGNLRSITDPRNNTSTYGITLIDKPSRRTDPLLRSDLYTYDLLGNVVQYQDGRGFINAFSYDGLGRRIFAGIDQLSNSPVRYDNTIEYVYDAADRLTQAQDAAYGTVQRTYDNLDRLISEASCPIGMGPPCPSRTITYAYDAAGRRISMQVPGQALIAYKYDDANHLTKLIQGKAIVKIGYDADGRRTDVSLPNGVTMAYAYDAASRITNITYERGGAQLGNLTYTYDAIGRRVAQGGTWARASLPMPLPRATYDAAGQLTTWGNVDLNHDSAGDLRWDGTNAYVWDGQFRLREVIGDSDVKFGYDPLGRRTMKDVDGKVTQYLYDGLNPVQELSATGAVEANVLTGGLDEYFVRTVGGVASYFLTDALHSTVALLDGSGSVTTEYAYDPFGGAAVHDIIGTSTNPFQYAGRERDETGLSYYRARYYSPTLQRFVSQDPLVHTNDQASIRGFGGRPNEHQQARVAAVGATVSAGQEPYSYAHNDPVQFSDPLGLWTVAFGVSGAVGAGGGSGWSALVVFDGSGNIGFEFSGGGGGFAGAGASAGGQVQVTDAPDIYSLGGGSLQVGGSIGEGPSAGGEEITGPNYSGFDLTVGWSFGPTFLEEHGFLTDTAIVPLSGAGHPGGCSQ